MARAKRLLTISLRVFTPVMLSLLLGSCGGGGGQKAVSTGYYCDTAPGGVTASGLIQYIGYALTPDHGIDYSTPLERPVRGAVVQVLDSSGRVYSSCNTAADGGYSISVPANADSRLIVKAELGDPKKIDTRVVDNTRQNDVYALYYDVTAAEDPLSFDLIADSGWDGYGYSGERKAAPFAILDSIYRAQQFMRQTEPGIQFPPLIVNWSIKNKPVEGMVSLGEVGGTHYSGGNIYLLGAANIDTDEYDDQVIMHEWTHYFIANFSRSDNIGGQHGTSDILDPTVAFGEGFATALAAMISGDPVVIDTYSTSQGSSSPAYVEAGLSNDGAYDSKTNTILADGYYSEASVYEVVYDLYDSGVGDDDNVGLGFMPIYQTLIDGQKNTPAFTTIFSFLYYLKQTQTSTDVVDKITALAAAENILPGDEFEATDMPIYTDVIFDQLMVQDVNGDNLKTSDTFGPITSDDAGNALFNRQYFRYRLNTSGCYMIEMVPDSGIADMIYYNKAGWTRSNSIAGLERVNIILSNTDAVFAIGSKRAATVYTLRLNTQSCYG